MNPSRWWRKFLIPSILFGIILFVYIRTLCPTVYWEDAGELITVSRVLGIAHPPGHPLYTILGHLFTLIPHGSIAWRVNLMSAVFGALAAMLVYPVVLRLVSESSSSKVLAETASACAALCAAFSLTVWDQAVVAETSTLHAFFFMVLLLLFLTMTGEKDDACFSRRLFAFSFIYGLSLTNHVAGVFLLPAFLLWALVSLRKRILKPRRIVLSLVFFCVGLSVYLYLPLRSLQNPVIDWGNPKTLSNFWWVVSARQFQQNVFAAPSSMQAFDGLMREFADVRENFMGVGLFFILIGIWTCAHRRKGFLLFGLLVIGVLGAVTLNPAFISAYFIPALLVLAVFLGIGLNAAAHALLDSVGSVKFRPVLVSSLCAAILLTPVLSLLRHYPLNDRSNYYCARDYGDAILQALPANAAFFTIDLNAVFTIWYLQYCEGRRRDVLVVEPTWLTNSPSMRADILDRYPDLVLPEVGEKVAAAGNSLGKTRLFDKDLLAAVLEKNAQIRPVYWGAVPVFESLKPEGLVYEYVCGHGEVSNEESALRNRSFWDALANRFREEPRLMRDRVASLVYPENLRHLAIYYRDRGNDDLAQWALHLAVQLNPTYSPVLLELGELHMRKGQMRAALQCLEQAGNSDREVGARAHYQCGAIYFESAQYQRAAAEFKEVIKDVSDYPGAHHMLGSAFLNMGFFQKAELQFRKEISCNPSTAGAYSNLAQILIQRREYDEAEQFLRKGIGVQPRLWQNYYFLAQIEALRGKAKASAEFLDTAVRLGGAPVKDLAGRDDAFKNLAKSNPHESTP